MSSTMAQITSFGADGRQVGIGASLFLPDYLDWMPIEVKVFWFLERGYGEPDATHLLFNSQGEQRLVPVTRPLRDMKYTELQEQEHGLFERVQSFIDREGFSRVPRNQ